MFANREQDEGKTKICRRKTGYEKQQEPESTRPIRNARLHLRGREEDNGPKVKETDLTFRKLP